MKRKVCELEKPILQENQVTKVWRNFTAFIQAINSLNILNYRLVLGIVRYLYFPLWLDTPGKIVEHKTLFQFDIKHAWPSMCNAPTENTIYFVNDDELWRIVFSKNNDLLFQKDLLIERRSHDQFFLDPFSAHVFFYLKSTLKFELFPIFYPDSREEWNEKTSKFVAKRIRNLSLSVENVYFDEKCSYVYLATKFDIFVVNLLRLHHKKFIIKAGYYCKLALDSNRNQLSIYQHPSKEHSRYFPPSSHFIEVYNKENFKPIYRWYPLGKESTGEWRNFVNNFLVVYGCIYIVYDLEIHIFPSYAQSSNQILQILCLDQTFTKLSEQFRGEVVFIYNKLYAMIFDPYLRKFRYAIYDCVL